MAWVCRPESDCRCDLRRPGALSWAWVLGSVVCSLFSATQARAAGGGGGGASDAVILTTEALEESNQDAHPVTGRSEADLAKGRISISDFVLISGPSLNILSGYVPGPPGPPVTGVPGSVGGAHHGGGGGSAHAAASGGGGGGSFTYIPGYSMRDNFEGSYALSERVGIGPVLGVDHRFYGNHSTS